MLNALCDIGVFFTFIGFLVSEILNQRCGSNLLFILVGTIILLINRSRLSDRVGEAL